MWRRLFTSILSLSIVMAFVSSCSDKDADSASFNVTQSWELAGFKNPESVVYDSKRDRLYVSNVEGSPVEKDGAGSISTVSMDGQMLEVDWVSGLDSPKGLAIHNDHLYVADIDKLIEINMETGSISNEYVAEGAKFLNDVTARSNGEVYVSDMMTNQIYVLKDGNFSVWLESDALENPNGLLAEDDRLIVGTWGVMKEDFSTEVPGHLKTVDYTSKEIKSIGSGESIGNMDGIENFAGGYLVTDWVKGAMSLVDNNGDASLLLQLEQGMADHEVIESSSMAFIPMMKNDTLLAYKVSK